MRSLLTPQALAEAVADNGIDAHVDAVAAFVADARRFRVCDVLAALIIDPMEPAVARERALGRLVVTYCRLVDTQPLSEFAAYESVIDRGQVTVAA